MVHLVTWEGSNTLVTSNIHSVLPGFHTHQHTNKRTLNSKYYSVNYSPSRTQILAHTLPPSNRTLISPHPRRIPLAQPFNRIRKLRPQTLCLDLSYRVDVRLEREENRARFGKAGESLEFAAEECLY